MSNILLCVYDKLRPEAGHLALASFPKRIFFDQPQKSAPLASLQGQDALVTSGRSLSPKEPRNLADRATHIKVNRGILPRHCCENGILTGYVPNFKNNSPRNSAEAECLGLL